MVSLSAPRTAAIALCFDAGYIQPACVLLHSLGRHWEGADQLTVCGIVDASVSAGHRAQLASVADHVGIRLDMRQIKPLSEETRFPHLSPMAWVKLQAPSLLAPDFEVVLYLDSDMLACTSVHPLLRRPADGMVLAAVRDFCIPELGTPHLAANRFSLSPAEASLPYINVGLLLVDTAAWERQQITAQLTAVLSTEVGPDRLLFGDQDVLNAVVRGRVELLDPRWNVVPLSVVCMVLDFDYLGERHFPEHYRASLERDPWLIHYATGVKPWTGTYPESPAKQLWRTEADHVARLLALPSARQLLVAWRACPRRPQPRIVVAESCGAGRGAVGGRQLWIVLTQRCS